jgi:hypothetical protein
MSQRYTGWIGIALAIAFLAGAPNAFATSYTLQNDVLMSDGNGNDITLSGVGSDAGAQNFLAGVAGTDLLVVDVEVTSGSIEELNISQLIATAVGLGYYSDGETAPSSGSLVGGAGQFDFDAPNLTGDGNRLFISFNGFGFEGDAQFMAQAPGGLIFSNGGPITIVPEPGTLSLSALGLAALVAGARRRRNG